MAPFFCPPYGGRRGRRGLEEGLQRSAVSGPLDRAGLCRLPTPVVERRRALRVGGCSEGAACVKKDPTCTCRWKNIVQKTACDMFRKFLIKPKWNEMLERRRKVYFPSAPAIDATEAARIFRRGIGKLNCSLALKTALGAWHTSRPAPYTHLPLPTITSACIQAVL